MNENEVEVGGNIYIAVRHESAPYRCEKCAFDDGMVCLVSEVPPCSSLLRKDKRNVIFVEKQS